MLMFGIVLCNNNNGMVSTQTAHTLCFVVISRLILYSMLRHTYTHTHDSINSTDITSPVLYLPDILPICRQIFFCFHANAFIYSMSFSHLIWDAFLVSFMLCSHFGYELCLPRFFCQKRKFQLKFTDFSMFNIKSFHSIFSQNK